ncbi:hypothetical protein, partial [Streptomyces sp. NPDC088557]|uniref:hypothetical protein n=1 Tax=Streptomyces sp. NPDC088557 TaxID=3365867 RepID=UPI00382FA3D2
RVAITAVRDAGTRLRAPEPHRHRTAVRPHLVPIPDVDTLGDLNARTEQIEVAQDARPIGHRPTLVSFEFDHEASLL